MQRWSKGRKAFAILGSVFVLGSLVNAVDSPQKNSINTKSNGGTSSPAPSHESPIIIVPNPAPKVEPAPTPEPVPPPVATPAPPPRPNNGDCDPNYSGCVPIASDVDCAGGSGNGPAYVSGPVQVIGYDIYGLDRDGDDIACE